MLGAGDPRSEIRAALGLNRSSKGNMRSVIPDALLCMIVNWSERKQGNSPKGVAVLSNKGELSLLHPWVDLRPD